MPIISSTRARIRSFIFVPVMLWHTSWSWYQLKESEGFIQGKGLLCFDRVFWTVTAWKDIDSMYLYRDQKAHSQAMPWLSKISDEVSFAYWEKDDYSLPSWKYIHSHMSKNARFYPLNEGSFNHNNKIICAPRIFQEYFISSSIKS